MIQVCRGQSNSIRVSHKPGGNNSFVIDGKEQKEVKATATVHDIDSPEKRFVFFVQLLRVFRLELYQSLHHLTVFCLSFPQFFVER